MGLYEFFFPEQAQATHLQEIASNQSQMAMQRIVANAKTADLENRIHEVERDLGYAVLVLGAILEKLNEKGTVTRDEVRASMSALDSIDGVQDGSLDVRILRGKNAT